MSLPLLEQAASNLATQDVLPEVRDKFCGLWNQLVDMARKHDGRYDPITIRILKRVRQIFVAFHDLPETDPLSTRADEDPILIEVSSYPRCTTHTGHDHDSAVTSPDSAAAVHAAEGIAYTSTILPSPTPSHPATTTQYNTHPPPTSASRTAVSSSHLTPALIDAPSTPDEPKPQDSTSSSRGAANSHLTSVPDREITARTRTTDSLSPATASAALVDDADTLNQSTPPTVSRSRSPS